MVAMGGIGLARSGGRPGGIEQVLTRATSWSKSPASALPLYALAAAFGLATYLLVYGAGHLFGTSAYWQLPQVDERMALMGYRYFLHDTWHWPVFVNDAVNVPYPKSVAFLDCIPIWALINKAVATAIPPWKAFSSYAYLGLWHALAYMLQPCLGVACMRALGHRSWRLGLVSIFFFLAVPAWIFRYAHPALSAHWLILWALYLYLRTPLDSALPRRLGIAMLCQLAVAALVTPYHAAFGLLFFVPALLRTRHARSIATWLPLGLLCVALATWFAGYFAAESMRRQWGFEWNSANVLSWLVPSRSGIVGDAQWIANVNPTPYQYEGYAYLGLGYLALLAMAAARPRTVGITIRRHWLLFAVVVACCVFALSNHIYVGGTELGTYPLPSWLSWVRSQFRSPGRFVWIPTYVLIGFLLHQAYTRFATGRWFAVIVIAAAVQVTDATGDWKLQQIRTRPTAPLLDPARWRPLVHAHDAIMILPPYSCVAHENGWTLDLASMELQLYASERAMPINGTYSARDRRKCKLEQSEWTTLPLDPTTLYVLLEPARSVASRLTALGARCVEFQYGIVCSANGDALAP